MKLISFIILILSVFFSVACHDFTKVLAGLIIVFLINKGKEQTHVYNPYYILIITAASYLLYYAPIGGVFMENLAISTRILIVACLVAVYLGFRFCESKFIAPVETGNYVENYWFCFFVGALPTVLAVYLYGNTLQLAGDEMMDARENMSLPFLGQFAYWLPATIIIACKKNNSKLIILSLVSSLMVALITVTKTGMLIAIAYFSIGVTAFNPSIMEHSIIKWLKKTAFVWLPVLILLFFSYNNNIRHDASTNSDMAYIEFSNSSLISNTDNAAQGAFLNYLYFCSPWSNLDYNIRYQTEKGYGANTVYPFTRLLRIKVPPVKKLNPYFLNTHSFITDYYIDFGYIGAIIASFILGFFIFFFYSKFGCSDDPLLISFYVLVAYATCMMFFSNHFNNGYLLNYFITMVGYSTLFRKVKQ